MRLGPWNITRANAATAAAAAPAARAPRGASGVVNMAGWLQPTEYNPDLRGRLGLDMFRRMRRSDAAVREAYQHIVAPILNANWAIEPATQEHEDLEIAEMVRRAFFEWPVRPWQESLRTALLYLAQGYQVFEFHEQVVEAELTFTDPESRDDITVPRRQFLAWRLLGHRRPETIWKWNTSDGELESIVQTVFKDGDYEEIPIPADRLIVFTNEREGDDFTGDSILRPAYKAWWLKEVVEKVAGASVETFGIGVKTYYVPDKYANDAAMLQRIEEMGRDLVAGKSSYQVFPGPKGAAGAGAEGFTFEIVSPSGSVPEFVPLLDYLRGEIKGAVLARFAELGHGQTGARATGDTQQQVWYDALHGVADYVCEEFRESIRRLVQANYQTDRFPKLVARDIEARSLTEFASSNAVLVSAGAIVPDKSYRAYVRQGIDGPEEDEETDQQLQQEQQQQTEPEGNGAGDPQELQRRQEQQQRQPG